MLWARELLVGNSDGWDLAEANFLDVGHQDKAITQESEFILMDSHRHSACGSGYVLNSLWSAHIAMREPDYVSVVRAAIAFGDDTDTTACIAGGLAGIRDGLFAIPDNCRTSLRGAEVYQPLLQKLLAMRRDP